MVVNRMIRSVSGLRGNSTKREVRDPQIGQIDGYYLKRLIGP